MTFKAHLIYFFTILFLFSSSSLFTQNVGEKSKKKKKITKILLTDGLSLKTNDFKINNKELSYLLKNANPNTSNYKTIPLSSVKSIKVSTKNNALLGGAIGLGVGIAGMLITESIVEKPNSSTKITSSPGTTTTTTITSRKKLASGPKILMVTGGAGLGILVGASIKKGWETIFPNSNISINIFNNYQGDIPIIGVQTSLKF